MDAIKSQMKNLSLKVRQPKNIVSGGSASSYFDAGQQPVVPSSAQVHEEAMGVSITRFPSEILHHIFRFLSKKDLGLSSQVCKTFHSIATYQLIHRFPFSVYKKGSSWLMGNISKVVISPANNFMAITNFFTSPMYLYDLTTFNGKYIYPVGPTTIGRYPFFYSVAFTEDGRYLLHISTSGEIGMVDVNAQSMRGVSSVKAGNISKFRGDSIACLNKYVILSNCYAEGSEEAKLQMYNIYNGEVQRTFDTSDEFAFISLSNDELKLVACSTGNDKNLQVFDVNTGSREPSVEVGFKVHYAEFSNDNKKLICYGTDGKLEMWGLETRALIKRFPITVRPRYDNYRPLPQGRRIRPFSFSMDERYVAFFTYRDPHNLVSIWDVETGECMKEIICERKVVYAIFHPHNYNLIVADEKEFTTYEFPLAEARRSGGST